MTALMDARRVHDLLPPGGDHGWNGGGGAPFRPAIGRTVGGSLPPQRVLASMASYLTETLQLVDGYGIVRWHLGPTGGALRPGDPTGESAFAHVHPDDLPPLLEIWDQALSAPPGGHHHGTARVRNPDGTWCTCSFDLVNRLDDPALLGLVVRTRQLDLVLGLGPVDDLDAHDASVASLAETVPVALVVLDRHGRMQFANHAARELCDLPDGPTRGRDLADLAVESDRAGVSRAVSAVGAGCGSRSVVFATRGWRGREQLRLVEARLHARGPAEGGGAITASLEDVTERRREEDDLRRRASSDPLTGLLNRAAFLEEVDARLATGALTAIYCDLDGFKAVNDTLGHASGDEVLVAVGELLRSVSRSTDLIGRLGGDEFVIACDGLSLAHLTTLIARLDAAFDSGLGVRISVGVASSHAGGSAAELLGRADRAMYLNKRRSRQA